MAHFTAYRAVDLMTLYLGSAGTGQQRLELHHGDDFETPSGRTAPDHWQVEYLGAYANIRHWLGSGVSESSGLTGTFGTLYEERLYDDTFVPVFEGTGFVLDAGSVYAATISDTVGDDLAVLRAMLTGDDWFELSAADDRADGYLGNDVLRGGAGEDTLGGGDGRDLVHGEGGDDSLNGGAGSDTLDGGNGNDMLDGGSGDDALFGRAGNDLYLVDSAGDSVAETATGGRDSVRSTASYTLGAGVERLELYGVAAVAGVGNGLANVVSGSFTHNLLDGGSGDDTLFGHSGNDTLRGGPGEDELRGGSGNDVYVVGDAGDILIELGDVGGTDTVRAAVDWTLGAGFERLVLIGNTAIDANGNGAGNAISGNDAANTLRGQEGNDALAGRAGDDVLVGGTGNDKLTGGAGRDSFRFVASADAAANVDRVFDFVSGTDRLQFDDAAFRELGGVGAMSAAAWHVGTAAADASDRLIYDAGTGKLYYDADGTGAAAQVLLAQFGAGTVIGAGDLWVV